MYLADQHDRGKAEQASDFSMRGKKMPSDNWSAFFESWERLRPSNDVSRTKPRLDLEKFAMFAASFAAAYKAYCRRGEKINAWRASALGTDERRNCRVLAWLLDQFGDHGHGSVILEKLVHSLQADRPTDDHVRQHKYWTRTESLPLGSTKSRVDIEIESPGLLIFIEVKIQADETGDQIKRYVQLAERKAGTRPWVVLFLTPDGRRPATTEDGSDKVIPVSWKKIAQILYDFSKDGDYGDFHRKIISQFADHVMIF